MFKQTNENSVELDETVFETDEVLKVKTKKKSVKKKSVKKSSSGINTDHLGKKHADRAVKHFLATPHLPKVFGCYFIKSGTLTYRETADGQTFRVELIAVKIKGGGYIGNSSASKMQGKIQNQTACQAILSPLIPMIPFSVFQSADLKISEYSLIQKGPEETVVRRIDNPKYDYDKPKKHPQFIDETVHFIGASLFKVSNKYFLFDIDRNEIKNKIFNAFMTNIPRACKTIDQAYACLKPKEVKDAEKKGLKVLRQGEWFLIPVKGDFQADLTPKEDIKWLGKYRSMSLQAGNNQPNNSQYGVKDKMLCRGKFEHSGREHKTIVLKTWHKAVPNTAIGSFTIEGDVD